MNILYNIYYYFFYYFPRKISLFIKIHFQRKKYKFDSIRKYRNIYSGKRCFIVATAPSLTIEDLNLIKNEISFSVNSIVLALNKTTWRPTFYGIQDKNAYEKLENEIKTFRPEIKDCFLGVSTKKLTPKGTVPCTYYALDILDHDKKGLKHKTKCSKRIDKKVYDGHSITYSMIEIAMYMGFKEIILLGVDCDYSKEKNHFIEYTNAKVVNAAFHMYKSFEFLKKYAEKNGIHILNASRGWKLDVFDKVSLEELL